MAGAVLRVFANPYAALDGDGNCAGAVSTEGANSYFVGARLVVVGSDPSLGEMLQGNARAAKRYFEFDEVTPTQVETTTYYVKALQNRELFPADDATAIECGLKPRPLRELLVEAKTDACLKFLQDNGRVAACFALPLAGLPDTKPAIVATKPDHAAKGNDK